MFCEFPRKSFDSVGPLFAVPPVDQEIDEPGHSRAPEQVSNRHRDQVAEKAGQGDWAQRVLDRVQKVPPHVLPGVGAEGLHPQGGQRTLGGPPVDLPAALDFGRVSVAGSAERRLTIRNRGEGPLTLTSLSLNRPFQSLSNSSGGVFLTVAQT